MANEPHALNRQFAFHGFMRPWLGIYAQLIAGGKKPPTHFHAHQTEFFRVFMGNLSVDINGRRVDLTPADGEYTVPPFTHHVIYGTPGTEHNEVEFEVSADEKRDGAYGMDQPFFENWYGYQEDVFQRGVKLDFIQVLAVRTSHCRAPRTALIQLPDV
jgi:mannose-6-phosphate isomerase-like protein (cupin superfamily)